MGDVVKPEFGRRDEYPHMEGDALCMNCRRSWQARAPAGTTSLECPTCGTMKGVWVHPAFHDRPYWQCPCGNEFFVIHDDRFLCAHCGTQQRFDDG